MSPCCASRAKVFCVFCLCHLCRPCQCVLVRPPVPPVPTVPDCPCQATCAICARHFPWHAICASCSSRAGAFCGPPVQQSGGGRFHSDSLCQYLKHVLSRKVDSRQIGSCQTCGDRVVTACVHFTCCAASSLIMYLTVAGNCCCYSLLCTCNNDSSWRFEFA